MGIEFSTIQNCSRCQRADDHWCNELKDAIHAAIVEVEGRAVRHNTKMPACYVTIDCRAYSGKYRHV